MVTNCAQRPEGNSGLLERNKSNVYSLKLFELFKESVDTISLNPKIGKATDIDNIRFVIVKDYLIFYENSIDKILIQRIWDSRQNPESLKI
ncbi:type II toxin-antitoxin system RelE/ParE family toxin [Aequorivita lipolytica]|uniref:type II toxin-antitoxin system RelE/ParE family toxin n=1 Tax=Aequorivita lipolytica TaxID=153267 RepID=UPI000DBBDB40|nr:hypothetical protein AEQU2_00465 [Aequorivita lipolytica]